MAEDPPITPEGRRAAQKVLNGFMLLAAANVVLIGYVMWPFGKSEKPDAGPPPNKAIPVANDLSTEMQTVLSAAMKAWEKRDAAAFYSQFSAQYVPTDSTAVFDRLFAGVYADEFGKIGPLQFIANKSSGDPDFGMLVFQADCEKHPKARLTANFVRENGKLKLAQIRLEKL